MPETLVIQAKVPAKKDAQGNVTKPQIGPFQISVNTGVTAAEQIQMFGDEAVKTNADSNWTVTLQANMRNGMEKGETQEALQARLGGAKMGVSARGVQIDPVQAYIAKFQAATPEQRAAMLSELQAKAAE